MPKKRPSRQSAVLNMTDTDEDADPLFSTNERAPVLSPSSIENSQRGGADAFSDPRSHSAISMADSTIMSDPDWLDDMVGGVYTNNEQAKLRRSLSRVSTVMQSQSAPVALTWTNLNVHVAQEKTWRQKFQKSNKTGPEEPLGKQILFNLSGAVLPGQLVAIMGASGAGKSTFLNTLVQRNMRSLQTTGDVFVNGRVIGRKITAVSAYVQQDDLFIGSLTVREHMVMQALLRLPASMGYKEKFHRVDEVLQELGLTKCQHTKIGVPGVLKGISGGEKKRLAFACEVLTNPSIMFCDEPTTGLDSFMAESVVTVLQHLAERGKAVICTIHQPASEIYAMFDRIMFLAEGRLAFYGSGEDAIKFFSGLNFHCPIVYNPADYFIEVLAVTAANMKESKARVNMICDSFAKTEYQTNLNDVVDQSLMQDDGTFQYDDVSDTDAYSASYIMQFLVLVYRATLNNFRNPTIAMTRFIQRIGFGIFVGLLYFQLTVDQTGIQNINGVLYYLTTTLVYPAMFGVIQLLPVDFPIVCREHHDGMYSVWTYYVAKCFSYLPVFTTDGLLLVGISYFMIGLQPTFGTFLITLLIGVLVEQSAVAFGTMFSAIAPSFPIALTISGPIMTLISLTGGLYANVGAMPSWLSWIQYLSMFRYGFEAQAINQWLAIDTIDCGARNDTGCVRSGVQVLESLSFSADYGQMWLDCLWLFCLVIGPLFIGYFGLYFRVYRAR